MSDTIDAMQMTPAEFAAATRQVANDEVRDYVRRRDKDDLRKLGMSQHDIALANSRALMTSDERLILQVSQQIAELAREHAHADIIAEKSTLLESLRKKYLAS